MTLQQGDSTFQRTPIRQKFLSTPPIEYNSDPSCPTSVPQTNPNHSPTFTDSGKEESNETQSYLTRRAYRPRLTSRKAPSYRESTSSPPTPRARAVAPARESGGMTDHDHHETFPLLVSLGARTPSGDSRSRGTILGSHGLSLCLPLKD
jgi:hypothetical protein